MEDVGELRTGLAVGNIDEAGQRPEGEHEDLLAVGHSSVTIAAGDLLAFYGAVDLPCRHHISLSADRQGRRTGVGRFHIVDAGITGVRVSDGAGWTLDPE